MDEHKLWFSAQAVECLLLAYLTCNDDSEANQISTRWGGGTSSLSSTLSVPKSLLDVDSVQIRCETISYRCVLIVCTDIGLRTTLCLMPMRCQKRQKGVSFLLRCITNEKPLRTRHTFRKRLSKNPVLKIVACSSRTGALKRRNIWLPVHITCLGFDTISESNIAPTSPQ